MPRIHNNLTSLRWIAALLVFYGHAFIFMGLPRPLFLGFLELGPLGVYIFFSISGYLIAQSWDSDPNALRFLTRRFLRIFPGLVAVTLLTIFILGPAFTTLPLDAYFSSRFTWQYFLNIALRISYYLPGVFADNLYPNAVNGSLWSLTTEFSMYLLLLLLGITRLPRLATMGVTVTMMLLIEFWARRAPMLVFYATDLRQFAFCGVYFWVGATFYRYDLQRFFTLSNVCVAAIALLALTRWPAAFNTGMWILLPFVTLGFGLATGSCLALMTRHDYSYGIYIYAFPIQQAAAAWWPRMDFGLYLLVTLIATLLCAAVSWNFVERPALALKPKRRIASPA